MEKTAERQADDNGGVLTAQLQHGFVLGEQSQERFGGKQPYQYKEQGVYPGAQQSVYSGFSGFFRLLCAQIPGNTGIQPHAKTDGQRKSEVLQRID